MIILVLPLSLIKEFLLKSLGSQMLKPRRCLGVHLSFDIEQIIQMFLIIVMVAENLRKIGWISYLTLMVVHL